MATRTIWKGAISFGLIHIPVGLHTATTESGIDFDWLDRRSMDPVGYKRVNKRTGKEIQAEDIARGVEYEDGRYVILSPEEIERAYPRTTQTIDIQMFVDAAQVPFVYLERPYYAEPVERGRKVYALLRDTLRETGRIGIAKVVIHTRQHLAALVPSGDALVLNLMRWGDEVKPLAGLDLPAAGDRDMAASAGERKMARMLVETMSADWDPAQFQDEFRRAILALVEKKARAGKARAVVEPQEEAPGRGDNVIDLTELLRRSLKGKGGAPAKAARKAGPAADAAPRKTARKAAGKAAAKGAGNAGARAAPRTARKAASAARKTAGGASRTRKAA